MPATKRQQQATDAKLRRDAVLLAWKQCLAEHGLKGAMGCAHLAVEAGNKLADELRNSQRGAQ